MTETKSLFYKDSETLIRSYDENGNLAEGTRISTKVGKEIILRFRNGLLDGDSYTKDGKLIVQPAVETEGHIEYWRAGRLHRDNGLEAISSENFTVKEYWENGIRVEKEGIKYGNS